MEPRTCLSFFFLVFMSLLLSSSQAYIFSVGGRDGWVVKPSDAYGPWAGRNRFLISDTLVFKYNTATDSVLIVNKQDYESCSVSNPILKLEGGDSSYVIDRSGPFYFITGNQSNCQNGQKLLLVVLSPRIGTPPATPPPGVAPMSPPGSAPSPSTAPGPAPASPPGSAPSPSTSPGPAPVSSPGSVASPSTAPGTVPAASPTGAPITPSGADSPGGGGADSPGGGGGNTPGGATGDTAPNSSSASLSSSKGFALVMSLLVTLASGSYLRPF